MHVCCLFGLPETFGQTLMSPSEFDSTAVNDWITFIFIIFEQLYSAYRSIKTFKTKN